jgi:hypothetical protein
MCLKIFDLTQVQIIFYLKYFSMGQILKIRVDISQHSVVLSGVIRLVKLGFHLR